MSSSWWSLVYTGFNLQNIGLLSSRIFYFPQYCAVFGLQVDPERKLRSAGQPGHVHLAHRWRYFLHRQSQ